MRVVIWNPGPRLLFSEKMSFPGKWWYECLLFFEKAIPRKISEFLKISSLAAPSGKIGPPEHEKIPHFFAFFKYGGFWGKRSNARGKFMKRPHFSTIFTTQTLKLLTCVYLEKSDLQILKLRDVCWFWCLRYAYNKHGLIYANITQFQDFKVEFLMMNASK